MNIILKQDVEKLGFKNEIVSVKNGYGRNYLIPKGYGILATANSVKVLTENLKQQTKKEETEIAKANKIAEALPKLEIVLKGKVAEGGTKLFGSINNIDLADALQKEGHTIEKKFITVIGGSVKRLGKYDAVIRLHREVTVDLPFEVIAEA